MNKKISALSLAASLALVGGALTGCASGSAPADSSGQSVSTTAAAAAEQNMPAISVADAWVKATESDNDMSGLFGKIENSSDQERTIVKATSDSAGMVQLHTTVPTPNGGSVMKEKEGGFPVPAGGSIAFEPGANHVMLMDLKSTLKAGDIVKVTLTMDDGSTSTVEAPVKAFSGAKESYAPTGDSSTDH
ncbi:copper chaperone PCu(A)C [Galactobacter caseinivorans]|uniref:Copper chaperone PCu(A)C n=1 Tax=Galactobacter caseinivorans TaxID=2676123 RepID=A0A496PIB8_9MICC|nr:copper chaperone PCu(A)C [Galactobacter caseinivorans]RKW70200.1 copper chaperone PCu(A)C [Galactobacter caseinivorans]